MRSCRCRHSLLLAGLGLTLILPGSLPAQSVTIRRQGVLEQVEPDEPMTLVYPPSLELYHLHKATPAHLFLFLQGRTVFDDPQGIAATVLDSWDDPLDEKDDDEVTVYGVNAGRGEIIYNTSMYTLGLYGSKGSGVGQFRRPHGIDADPAGNLVVADTGNDRVAVMFNNGRILSHVGYLEAAAPGDRLEAPYDVALAPDSTVWIADSGNTRLVHLSLDGERLTTIDLAPILGAPGAVALAHPRDRWSYYRQHALYVASRDGREIVKLDPDGEVLARASAGDGAPAGMEIAYLTVDFYANVWATDSAGHCLHKFDRDLTYLVSFGHHGRGRFEFDSPRGIDIWPRFGQLFVAETRSAQHYWVGADATDLQAAQEGTTLRLSYRLTEYAYLTVRVRYQGGGLEELCTRSFRRVGRRDDEFELAQARPLGWVEIVVEPTYSSYTYREKVLHLRMRAPESR